MEDTIHLGLAVAVWKVTGSFSMLLALSVHVI